MPETFALDVPRGETAAGGFSDPVWRRVEELIDAAPDWHALRAHRLHLIAARIRRARHTRVPVAVEAELLRSRAYSMLAPSVLQSARAAYDGRLMLLKGPEVAARYAEPTDRPFHDLDLLAEDAPAAQRALIAAGFVEVDDPTAYDGRQHLCPLAWPDTPLIVEIHSRPNYAPWLPRIDPAEVLDWGVPSATGIDGLLAPHPAIHALLLTGHSWAHQALGRLSDLLDVTVMLAREDRKLASEVARVWGWGGAWAPTLAVADAVLQSGRNPVSVRLWGRHLPLVRERTVAENHFARLVAPVRSLPLTKLPTALTWAVRCTAERRRGESWSEKLHRVGVSAMHASMERSRHEETLERGSRLDLSLGD